MDGVNLAQDRDQWRTIVNMVMYRWFPQHSDKFLSILPTGGFWNMAEMHRANQLVS
jgi:hypothetical protein